MIAIIDSGGANISSIVFALERIGIQAELTKEKNVIQQASHVILPGVGAAGPAMTRLRTLDLLATIRNLKQPVLGICLGMQLLYAASAEDDTECLGILPGKVFPIEPQPGLTIPHMGWNQLQICYDSPLFQNIPNDSYVYFVHSFAARVQAATCATVKYGEKYTAICQQLNFYGVQFHPERSATVGEQLLKNFMQL